MEDSTMSRFALAAVALVALSAQQVSAQVANSGMLLGVYAHPANGGMCVTRSIPGYSAEGRLFSGDVLLQVTSDGFEFHQLRSSFEMEHAKMDIGANRPAALEVFRPGHGLIYMWVEFTPTFVPVQAHSQPSVLMQKQQYKAKIMMESERPGARKMFQQKSRPGSSVAPQVRVVPGKSLEVKKPAPRIQGQRRFGSTKGIVKPSGSKSASNLFGR